MQDLPPWYEPERVKATARPIIEVAAPALERGVTYGVQVCVRALHSAVDVFDSSLALRYRHLLEMVDACIPLTREVCMGAMGALLRSAWETQLAIEYMAAADTERRQKAVLVADVHRRLKKYKVFDARLTESAELYAHDVNPASARITTTVPDANLDETRSGFEAWLQRVELQEVEAEWQRVAGQRLVPWYSLFAGPKNMRELAQHLKRGHEYLVFYGPWSEKLHGETAGRVLHKTPKGAAMRAFRDPSELRSYSVLALNALLDSTRHVLQHYRAEEWNRGDFSRWYEQKMQAAIVTLTEGKRPT